MVIFYAEDGKLVAVPMAFKTIITEVVVAFQTSGGLRTRTNSTHRTTPKVMAKAGAGVTTTTITPATTLSKIKKVKIPHLGT